MEFSKALTYHKFIQLNFQSARRRKKKGKKKSNNQTAAPPPQITT